MGVGENLKEFCLRAAGSSGIEAGLERCTF